MWRSIAESQEHRAQQQDLHQDYTRWDEIVGRSMAAIAEPVSDPSEVMRVGKLILTKLPDTGLTLVPLHMG
jgi:hypothetical protein